MDINRRKQSEERSKGLSVFSISVSMEKRIFPSSHTERTTTSCFLEGTCPRKLALGPTAQCGFCPCWEHLAQVRVGVLACVRTWMGRVVWCSSLLGGPDCLKGWARLSEKMEVCGSYMKDHVLLGCCWKTVVQWEAEVSHWSCSCRLQEMIRRAGPCFHLVGK